MKIFLVEDNEELNGFITDTLEKLNYSVKSCRDGANAFKVVEDFFDLYIIDINLPNVNGLELVKKIRSVNIDAKIFIISGDDNIDTILKAYDLGCNDYIKKPFDLREVIAKINIMFKDKLEKKLKLTNECYYDTDDKVISFDGKSITLTPKEASLLNILIENFGKSVSNKDIEMAVWGKTSQNSHVRQLVSKLKKTLPCGSDIIQNHSSNGYKIVSSF
jgi:DNA-binding response OmpR family regulator